MDINEFIEQDVLIFLDERVDDTPEQSVSSGPTLYLTRDYEKELTEALQRHDIIQAKLVLHALKDQFDTYPEGTPDKEQLKTLLLTLYERLKDHLDATHTAAAATFVTKQEPAQTVSAKETPQEEPAVPQFDYSPLHTLLTSSESALSNGDIKAAAEQYRDAKRIASNAPSIPQDIVVQLLSLHGRIQQAITHAKTPSTEMDRQLLLQLEQEKLTLDTLLRASNVKGALEQYRRMRIIAQQLRDETAAAAAAEKMHRIHRLLEQLRTSAIQDEQRLGSALP